MDNWVEKVAGVRSAKVGAAMDYLRWLPQAGGASSFLGQFGRSLQNPGLRIELNVLPFAVNKDQDELPGRRQDRARGQDEADEAEGFSIGREEKPQAVEHQRPWREVSRARGQGEADEAEGFSIGRGEMPRTAEHQRPWREVSEDSQHRRLVLLGDPGAGKSEALRWRVHALAELGLRQLDSCEHRLEDIDFPVLVRLPELAQALRNPNKMQRELQRLLPGLKLQLSGDELLAAAILSVVSQHKEKVRDAHGNERHMPLLAPVLHQWLWQRLTHGCDTGGLLLCLDALDEVRENRDELLRALNSYGLPPGVKLLLTSRRQGYLSWPFGAKADPQAEWELAAFARDQREQFVRAFFGKKDADKAQELIRELQDKEATVGDLATNPLMATLLCLAYVNSQKDGKPLQLPMRRVEVYKEVLRGMLWQWKRKEGGLRLLSENDVEPFKAFAAELAAYFYPRLEFTPGEIGKLWETLLRDKKHPSQHAWKELRARYRKARVPEWTPTMELEALGLLASSSTTKLAFLHTTIHEHLVAVYLHSVLEPEQATHVHEGWEKGRCWNPDRWQRNSKRAVGPAYVPAAKLVNRKAWDLVWWRVPLIHLAGLLHDPAPWVSLIRSHAVGINFSCGMAGECGVIFYCIAVGDRAQNLPP